MATILFEFDEKYDGEKTPSRHALQLNNDSLAHNSQNHYQTTTYYSHRMTKTSKEAFEMMLQRLFDFL